MNVYDMDDLEESVHWYAARVRYGTEIKIKAYLDEIKIEHFIPFKTITIEYKGQKRTEEKPLIPRIIFVRTTCSKALSLPHDSGYRVSYIRNIDTKEIQIIPDKQMEDCMFIFKMSDKSFNICGANVQLGDKVHVVRGPFAGIEGELVRIKGHKRVIVRIESVFSLAANYIPDEYLVKFEHTVK